MDIVQAYEILQDASKEDPEWQKAKALLGEHIMTHEGFAWARSPKYYEALLAVYIRMIERLAEPYEGPKGALGAGRESEKGVYGSYIWPVTERRVIGRIATRTKSRQKDLWNKERKWRTSVPVGDEYNNGAVSVPADDYEKRRKYDHEVVMHALSDAHEEVGGRYVDDLNFGEQKVQQRTIDNAQRMVKGDNMLLREDATYDEVLQYHGGDPNDAKSRNTTQQRISRARKRFARWSRDIPDSFYIEVYEESVSASTLVERVIEVLTTVRKALQ